MTYEEWEVQVPADIKGDRLWEMELYRLALFLCDLAWEDATTISKDFRGKEIARQLIANQTQRKAIREETAAYSIVLPDPPSP